ncbi:hypothetical protein C8N26_2019 [Tenacibaculum lutimaris]|uniref:DOD-type homing endonuclease domain-containing protein n=1 Tax=Tenacibaculum lutimaris TaxID=285258 RepID=A0A420E0M0_9FLAO|nr:hypothetical protein [Tenacibaculum lutimaris]RKF03629.1 hypothetical protein C8N26_2019 [Tenacibaculum lutimaris]
MKRKCSACDNKENLTIYPNKLCQRCFSKKKEDELLIKGIKLPISSKHLIDNYLVREKPIRLIALENNLKPHKISSILDYYLIPKRNFADINKKSINENIFQDLNTESAYLLGYIFTDGHLALNKKKNQFFLHIYSKYKYQLENVKEIFKSNSKIQYRRQTNYGGIVQGEIYWIYIENQKIIKSLLGLGMTTNKNTSIKFPEIPEHLKNHFLRGCWAGSGCVSLYKNTILSQITIGSIDFIEEIERYLNLNGLKKRNIYSNKNSKKDSYVIRYATKDSEKLYKLLYGNKTQHTTCKRHEKKYVEKFGPIK